MRISSQIQVYLKTTETCNLNCSHCFTSGNNGKKIFFNPHKSLDFFDRLFEGRTFEYRRILFHGGEPMLAPIKDMKFFADSVLDKYPDVKFGIQTNLVYPLIEEKRAFFNEYFLNEGIGTSWDYGIRFGSSNGKPYEQQILWENNVRALIADGHFLSVMISLNKGLVENFEPADLIQYLIDLGVQNVLFERITANGNATLNPEVQPQNKDLDQWLLRMYEQTIEHKFYEKIHNMFLSEIATTYIKRLHVANRCRNCEQSLLTINADGTIAGCPNSAPEESWGNIEWSLEENFNSKKRLHIMACEMKRNDNCFTCPVSSICNGDCHRLVWQGNICAAPKSLMIKMKTENKVEDYKKIL